MRVISQQTPDPPESALTPTLPWFVNPVAWTVLAAIAVYRHVAPDRWKPACRFTPSCSRYMSLAIRKYGLVRGIRQGRDRFSRCIGFMPDGEDWP